MDESSDVYKQFAAETGGKYKHYVGVGVQDRIEIDTGPWRIVMSRVNRTLGGGDLTTVNVVGATFVTTGNLRFTINRATMFTRLGKLLGMQDITIGDQAFDADFVVKGNDVESVKALLADERIRMLLLAQPKVYLTILDDEGLFTRKFRKDEDELYFQVTGEFNDVERLGGLLDLFIGTLNRLVVIGAATEQNPNGPFMLPSAEELESSTCDNTGS